MAMRRVLFAAILSLSLCLVTCIEKDALNFIVLGDWGGQETSPYYTRAEKEIAEEMGEKAKEINAQFVMALGDNFYYHGVKDVHDTRFKSTFEVMNMS